MAAKVTPSVAVQISANLVQFKTTLDKAANDLKNFGNQINKIGNTSGVAFGTYEVLSFGVQVAKLAGQADAVRAAFERLPGSVLLMRQLKDATGETVSEFELMQRAVQASNFGIELGKLPKLLEFATLRAQQTGQSVDYLVGSIIQGIGKKSPMVLDNLGISLVRLREELKGTGTEVASVAEYTAAVGRIIDTDLANMAGFAETAATKMERLGASWTNLKVYIGEAVNEAGLFNQALNGAIGIMDILSSKDISWIDKFLFFSRADVGALKQKADIVTKMFVMEQRRVETSTKATEDAKKVFEEFNKKTTDYDSIRKASAIELEKKLKDFNALLTKQYNLQNFGRANSEEENNLLKLKTVYQKDFNAQIEALIAQLKKANEESIDPDELEKQLNEAAKKWEDYYKKITKGSDIIQPNTLLKEIASAGLAQPKKTASVLAGPTKDDILKGFDALIPSRKVINKMQEIQNASLAARDAIVNDNLLITESFKNIASEGIATFATSLGEFLADESVYKNFGRQMLKSISGFMKEFGKQLILIGAGNIALGLGTDKVLVARGLRQIAAGSALSLTGGYMSGSIGKKERQEAELEKISRGVGQYGLRSSMNRIEVTGTLVGSGRDLVAVIDNTNFDNKFRKGG